MRKAPPIILYRSPHTCSTPRPVGRDPDVRFPGERLVVRGAETDRTSNGVTSIRNKLRDN